MESGDAANSEMENMDIAYAKAEKEQYSQSSKGIVAYCIAHPEAKAKMIATAEAWLKGFFTALNMNIAHHSAAVAMIDVLDFYARNGKE